MTYLYSVMIFTRDIRFPLRYICIYTYIYMCTKLLHRMILFFSSRSSEIVCQFVPVFVHSKRKGKGYLRSFVSSPITRVFGSLIFLVISNWFGRDCETIWLTPEGPKWCYFACCIYIYVRFFFFIFFLRLYKIRCASWTCNQYWRLCKIARSVVYKIVKKSSIDYIYYDLLRWSVFFQKWNRTLLLSRIRLRFYKD